MRARVSVIAVVVVIGALVGVENAGGPFRRGRVVTVWSQNSDAACGLEQGIGDLYGLFVSRDDGRWVSGLCSTVSPKKMRRAARGAQLSAAPGSACG